MRLLAIVLTLLALAIQWPLWLGRGGWLQAWQLQADLERRRAGNVELEARNTALAAEVQSLRDGREAIEEQARMQLNMIRADETFFQFVPAPAPNAPKTKP
ncbi:MAG TPA: cell division protein FtsB [Burkholderiaceae bacterium]|jgi:cell division protein FtsB|nr:cell division protein FtsB [Burkholderiaceae bacterium]